MAGSTDIGAQIDKASTTVASAKQQQGQQGGVTVVAVNTTQVIKKPSGSTASRETMQPVAA